MLDNPPDECVLAIGRIVPRIDLKECAKLCLELYQAKIITKKQSQLYIATMSNRFNQRLKPAFEKHFGPLLKDNDSEKEEDDCDGLRQGR